VPFADAAVPSVTVDRREALVLQVVDSRQ
jgi:hypothetical protein